MSGLDLYQSQSELLRMLVWATLTGMGLGCLYDLLRALRILTGLDQKQGSTPLFGLLLFFEDLLLALTASVSLILLCYYINDGQLRAPAVMGMACGFFVYSHTLGRLAVAVSERAMRLLRRLLALLVRLLIAPVKGLWSLTVGRAAAARRERMTEKRIRALTESAARGFESMAEDPPENSEPPA